MFPLAPGMASSTRDAVIKIDHTNSGSLNKVMPGARMLKMVAMKLIAPRIEEAPARAFPVGIESEGFPTAVA